MNASQFDRLASAIGRVIARRAVARTLLAGAALGIGLTNGYAGDVQARKKKGKKKKKKQASVQTCVTYGEVQLTCDPGYSCCDPFTSTIGGCSETGFPVCCASNLFGHIRGSRCCAVIEDGLDGFCPNEAPICCSSEHDGGCCSAAYPFCCLFECCAEDEFCASDGFCSSESASRRLGSASPAAKRKLRSASPAQGNRILRGD